MAEAVASRLEELIRSQSERVAKGMLQVAKDAHSEEDVRAGVARLLDDFIDAAGLTVDKGHEYGVGTRRLDSKYSWIFIEYKHSKGPAAITENRNSPGTQAVIEQIRSGFDNLRKKEKADPKKLFGVGTDGDTLVFGEYRGRELVIDVVPATPYSVSRLLRAFVSIGARGRAFTPPRLAEDFGVDGEVARRAVAALYASIADTDSPKARTFFDQWRLLFGEVCGYSVDRANPQVRKLAEHYGLPADASTATVLFSLHTYYSIFMKLLASEILALSDPYGRSPVRSMATAATSEALKTQLGQLELGDIWAKRGITNFLEGDLFAWYIPAWTDEIGAALHDVVRVFNTYDPATLSVSPEESRDLLKKLYQQLFPKAARKSLGEYYTPDWLSEHTLDRVAFEGDPHLRLLDPSCGSGTFLVMAINRIKSAFASRRHEWGMDERELLQLILANVVGFDLNPLAVMAARTNYLLAIRDLLMYADADIEIPVYLCDSIVQPMDLSVATDPYRYLQTAVGAFRIPVEVAHPRDVLNQWTGLLELAVRCRYKPTEFLRLCKENGIPTEQTARHREVFEQMLKLDAEGKDGIWARVIKNQFAPTLLEPVDVVVGNPPWVNWENLPKDYRDQQHAMWERYGLFSLSRAKGRLGGGKKDLSMLFVYACADRYLRPGGKLAFVITQTVFKTAGAGDGFRRLRYKGEDGRQTYLKPLVVDDMSDFQPFLDAANRTAVAVFEKTESEFSYPVEYVQWAKRSGQRLTQELALDEVEGMMDLVSMSAAPIQVNESRSPWLTLPTELIASVRRVAGKSPYVAHAGSTTWLNGVFWLNVLEVLPNGLLLVENLWDVGKKHVQSVRVAIEPDLVYPLIRGRDVLSWKAEPSASMLLTQNPVNRSPLSTAEMKTKYPRTYDFLAGFEDELRGRSGYLKYYGGEGPFWALYNVGAYTLSPWKVGWPEVGTTVRAGVIAPAETGKTPIPDHKVVFVPVESGEEAYYLCGVLNSSLVQALIRGYVGISISTHVMNNINIPRFSSLDATHVAVSEMAASLAEMTVEERRVAMGELDRRVGEIWGLADDEASAATTFASRLPLDVLDPDDED